MLGGDNGEGRRTDGEEGREEEVMTQGEIVRRRRLAAFRWTMTLSASYVLYRCVRRLLRALVYGGEAGQTGPGQLSMRQSRGYYNQPQGGMMHNQSYGSGMGGGYGNGYGMNRYGGGGGYGQGRYGGGGYGGMDGGYY